MPTMTQLSISVDATKDEINHHTQSELLPSFDSPSHHDNESLTTTTTTTTVTPENNNNNKSIKLPTVTLTPSATIRNRYYQKCREEARLAKQKKQQEDDHKDDEDKKDDKEKDNNETTIDNNSVGWPMSSYYAPLKSPLDSPKSIRSFMSSEAGSVVSLRTEVLGTDDTYSLSSMRTTESNRNFATTAVPAAKTTRSNTLFRSRTGAEPKIVLDRDDHRETASLFLKRSKSRGAASLLSRLSKTTAPMRAKLSAMSRSGSSIQLRSLEAPTSSSSSFSTPLRRSAESMLNMPITPIKTIMRSHADRAQSFSFSNDNESITRGSPTTPSESPKILGEHQLALSARKIYPALLSKVAEMMQERITVTKKIKDSIEHKDAFEGKEAVDKLVLIIGTNDRNLALLVGRALDSQKFFHDVNYEHRLRDSSNELYQFQHPPNLRRHHRFLAEEEDEEDEKSEFNFMDNVNTNDDDYMPNGIFTLLTDCYSPTCTRENLCYSVFCPRRLEQQQVKQKTLHRSSSKSSLVEREDRLWINIVPKQVSNKLSKEEKKRQENIFELIYTERDFVDDLSYVQKHWITPLLEGDYIPVERRNHFVQEVFWNISEVCEMNTQLAVALEERQKMTPVVDQIGDIMLQHVASFGPFVQYGSHQMVSRHVFETEKATNPSFAQFVQMTERLPQSRKLELNGYLTKPTTRLGRYNLLLREILKHTPSSHPDHEYIPKAMNVISEFLSDVNHETGKIESRFNIRLLIEKLSYKAPISVDDRFINLHLDAESREIIMKGPLKRKGANQSESADMQVFLLDNSLLIVKSKFVNNLERYKIYKKPIPLALLSISFPDQSSRRGSSILPYGRPSLSGSISSLNNIDAITSAAAAAGPSSPVASNKGYPITFNYLGRDGISPITLYAGTLHIRRQWVDKIQGQRQTLMEKQKVFDIRTINSRFFNSFNRVTCAASYGESVVIGSNQGVYIRKDNKSEHLVRLLATDKVSQIDVLESSGLILVLAEKILHTYSIDSLLDEDSTKRGRKLSSHVSFFKVGTIFKDTPNEKTLVCFVRNNAITSTIRALEPHAGTERKSKSKLGRLMRGSGGEGLKVYKDLYIPAVALSIQYFKNIICVGSAKGFEMVDLTSTEVQSVLDPNDESHHALLHRENIKPISMFRHPNGNILLCYNEMAFYIDKKGRRARSDWLIRWEGQPTAFALNFPYIAAFDSTFIEVRHMDTGDLVQVIPGKNIRCLKPDAMDTIYCAMDDPVLGSELVFELIRLE
ncbi:CNH domain-containing protein [Phascolomyces articulosus]|uniref:CNH domain-containing protein n=1 Tax=Phascolomyces articulosus TaxID=60185 RepID=A0AAD5PGT5_9FUNG|nr:CNH domain-containing protein [Phascolomyces articulosus]